MSRTTEGYIRQLQRRIEALEAENRWAQQFTCPKCGPCSPAMVTTKKTCLQCDELLICGEHPELERRKACIKALEGALNQLLSHFEIDGYVYLKNSPVHAKDGILADADLARDIHGVRDVLFDLKGRVGVDPRIYGRFEVRQEEDTGRKYWWGAEDGSKDTYEIGADGVISINAEHFALGTIIEMREPNTDRKDRGDDE